MSCNKEGCKCMFSPEQIWEGIKLPPTLLLSFEELEIFFNGHLLTPSFALGKGKGDYDLLDNILVFNNHKVEVGSKVVFRTKTFTEIFVREGDNWILQKWGR